MKKDTKNTNKDIINFYLTDEYITKNPSLDIEDSPWKVSKIIPLVNKFTKHLNKDEITLLDVGGGAGAILSAISTYIKKKHHIKVNKIALDLSPGMLKIQKKNNPDLKKALNEDIRQTSLGNKEIDLTLMIDVLEHIPNPTKALKEIKRISKFVIFKVPLEGSLVSRIWNFINRNKPRQHAIKTIGHINVYNLNKLKYQIEKHTGQILDYYFTNVFEYCQNSPHYKDKIDKKRKLKNLIASYVFKISPKLCSFLFSDFVMILVKCY